MFHHVLGTAQLRQRMILLFQSIQPSTHLSMLQLDTGTGSSSRATQAVATGFLHRLNTMFLRYPPRTHRPRPPGSLTLSRTQRRGMTCRGTTPTSSSCSSTACSSTRSIQCPCTSRHKTPAATPRPLGLGVLGCRISRQPWGWGERGRRLESLPGARWTSGLYWCDSCLTDAPNLGPP